MEITWLGYSCFRLKGKEATVITDPYDASIGYSLPKQPATIVTVSHGHPAHANTAAVGGARKVIQGPGEYEVSGVMITGAPTYHDAKKGKEQGKNTVYLIELDDMTVCHLGDLGHVPTAEQTEELSNVDILLVPVGGGPTIDATAAVETISVLEPRLVIPMHYSQPGLRVKLDPLDRFLKEMGVKEAVPQPKLTITKSHLPDQVQVLVLEERR